MSNDYDSYLSEMYVDCDGCLESFTFYGDYQECINEMKDNGWLITKQSEEWLHFCPKCKTNCKSDPTEVFQNE